VAVGVEVAVVAVTAVVAVMEVAAEAAGPAVEARAALVQARTHHHYMR
jgi:hypothetical protein